MPKYCFPLSTFASSVAKHNDVALLVYTSFLMIVYEIWNPTWHNEYSSKLYYEMFLYNINISKSFNTDQT